MAKKKVVVAPIFTRVKAFIIDTFMIFMPILYITTYLVLGTKEQFLQSQIAIFVCNLMFGIILSLFFTILAQSPGYKSQSIYLISQKTGKKIGFFLALFRYFCFVLAGASVVGLLICFFRKDKLCLHDLLSQSIAVIQKDTLKK